MKLIRNIWLLLMVLFASSCGELFELNVNDADPPDGVVMSHHDIDILVGDSVFIEAKIYPDTAVVSYKWSQIGEIDSGHLVGNWLYAVAPGEFYVKVEAENIDIVDGSVYSVSDECRVNVFDWTQGADQSEYLYETIVYASLEIDNEDITDAIDGLRVVAVVKNEGNDEVRACAEMKEAYGVNYLQFRIGSYWPGEKATIECYHPELHQRFVFEEITLNGSTYGLLSDLVKLVGYSKD